MRFHISLPTSIPFRLLLSLKSNCSESIVARPGPLPPVSPARTVGRPPTPSNLRTPTRQRSLRTQPPSTRPLSANIFDLGAPNYPSAHRAHQRTRSPSPTRADNFVRPSDVDENGHLLATVTTFPRHALRIMQEWTEHLPLHILTIKSIQQYNKMPTSDIQYAQATSDGSLTLITKGPDCKDELKMTEGEWRLTIPTYLRLIRYHCKCPNCMDIVQGLQKHFDWIAAQPNYYQDFLLYLRYDIKIRGFIATTKYVPTGYEPNIFQATRDEYVTDLARNRIVSNPGNEQTSASSGSRGRSRSASPRRNSYNMHSSTNFQPSGRRDYRERNRDYRDRDRGFRPYSSSGSKTFCIACGQNGHASYECRSSKAPFLVKDRSGRWLGPDGAQLCYKWNNDATSCQGCNRDHRCTLCGNKGHSARKCSRIPA